MTIRFEVNVNYDHLEIEKKVDANRAGKNEFYCEIENKSKKKFYSLAMFPYPSGNAHMGHVLVYTLSDIKARFKKLKDYEVLHPMGWDAFGLPAENAAIKNKVRPDLWTGANIKKMKDDQLNRTGWSFDWDKELNTCSPDYYKWTQWLFLEMLKAGKAYKKAGYVNWCPEDQTVLANEQVIAGHCYRDGAVVEKKLMDQWFFRITDYAPQLWDDLAKLGNWASEAVAVQRNWINKNTGTNIDFTVPAFNENVRVFTTRADTLFGVTAVVLAPEHPLTAKILEKSQDAKVQSYVEASLKKSQVERLQSKDKTGVKTAYKCRHPFAESCAIKEVDIWIGDYVIGDYGTGAVMCVPAHDSRDYEFAKSFGLPVVQVVTPTGAAEMPKDDAFTDHGTLINSGEFDGLSSSQAIKKISAKLIAKNLGEETTTYQLRDWSVGRQRFWGCPIPIIYCDKCGTVPVAEKDLPVLLPNASDSDMKDGVISLKRFDSFVNTQCPTCGNAATRETDTLDTFLCSSWYAFRYLDNKNSEKIFDSKRVNHWMPIDFYVGGLEHAAQHMIYFRFITKFLKDRGYINFDEPVDHFFANGMIRKDGAKMSKSKGNVVVPTDVVETYGGDAVRLYILSDTPAELDRDWDDKGIKAKQDFIKKNFNVLSAYLESKRDVQEKKLSLDKYQDQNFLFDFYITLNEYEQTLENNLFNSAVAKVHALSNIFLKQIANTQNLNTESEQILKYLIKDYLISMGVFLPFTSEILLKEFYDEKISVYNNTWPEIPQKYLERSTISIAVQINGKKRAVIELAKDCSESVALETAFTNSDVIKHTQGLQILKKIYVAGKIINIVVKG